jgi:hypothetical protein
MFFYSFRSRYITTDIISTHHLLNNSVVVIDTTPKESSLTTAEEQLINSQPYEHTLVLSTPIEADIVISQAYEQTLVISTKVEEELSNKAIYEQTSLVNDKYTTHDQLFMTTDSTTSTVIESTSLPYTQTSNHMAELTIKTQEPMTGIITDKYNQSTILTLFNNDNETDGNMVITINISGVIYDAVYTHNPGIVISEASNSVKTYPFWMDWRLGIIYIVYTFFLIY